MPSGKTHAVAGALAGGLVMYKIGGPATIVLAAAFGGLLPDVDHRNSILGRYGFWWLIFKHRGFTHSIVCWIIVTVLATKILPGNWGIGISVGYLSHLMLDFIPLCRRKKRRKQK